jgi:hypothetical protein
MDDNLIKMISEQKKDAVRNLYLSGIGEEFIAMQVDLEIPVVISILRELGIYRSVKEEEVGSNLI